MLAFLPKFVLNRLPVPPCPNLANVFLTWLTLMLFNSIRAALFVEELFAALQIPESADIPSLEFNLVGMITSREVRADAAIILC